MDERRRAQPWHARPVTRFVPCAVGSGYLPAADGGRWLPDLDQKDDQSVPPEGEIVAGGLLALLEDGTVFAALQQARVARAERRAGHGRVRRRCGVHQLVRRGHGAD
jgi:hypothetical protein